MDVRRLAWSVDVTEIRCMNSVEVDATKLAWRVDQASAGLDSEPWSLDSEAWIPDAAKPRIDLAVLSTMW